MTNTNTKANATEKTLVNLTPHAVNVYDEQGNCVLTVEPSGTVTRCKAETVKVGEITVNGVIIPITKTKMGAMENVPAFVSTTLYIVSRVVADAAGREDFVVPDSCIRNDKGQIVGCMSLSAITESNSVYVVECPDGVCGVFWDEADAEAEAERIGYATVTEREVW